MRKHLTVLVPLAAVLLLVVVFAQVGATRGSVDHVADRLVTTERVDAAPAVTPEVQPQQASVPSTPPQPVDVVNNSHNPVPVTEPDPETHRHPLNIGTVVHIDPSSYQGIKSLYTVPEHKRLVVQYVSVELDSVGANNPIVPGLTIVKPPNDDTVEQFLPTINCSESNCPNGPLDLAVGTPITIYLDAGWGLDFDVSLSEPNTVGFTINAKITLSGYLVDMP